MNDLTRCSRCILPSTLDSITFDDEGICNHCRKYEKDFDEWDKISLRREKEFEKLLDKAKSLKRPYDCLVPLSGGKDSTYALWLCTSVYKLRTLAVTYDNGYLSTPARDNIRNALRSCNADHIFYSVNKSNSARLFRTFTLKTGDFCNACMRGINYSIENAVRSFKIPLVIKGSGRRVQYVSQIKEVTSLNTASYFANVIKGTVSQESFGHFAGNKHRLELQKIAGGIADIFGISRTAMMKFIPQHVGMYDYLYKPFPEIVEIIRREMGWKDASGSVEHLDCELHDIPFYRDTLKIPGITKYTFHSSGLIRQGLMTREEALAREEEEIRKGGSPPELQKFLDENGIMMDDYVKAVKRADNSRYEPSFQKMARNVYHRFRRF